jgi:nucleotidyltransferase substrate binding protein (TIGR01987 family)
MAVSIQECEKSVRALKEALLHPKTDMNRDATIERFEFVVELAWKTAKQIMGTQTYAPKEVVREMARANLIPDPIIWLNAIDNRNLTSHTYNEEQAEKIYAFIVDFFPHAENLIERLKKCASA